MFSENSVISHVNKGEHYIPKTETGKMFLEVYQMAMKISAETDGAFDITVAPLVNAWGFGFKHDEMPTDAQVDSILQFVGYDKCPTSPNAVAKASANATRASCSTARPLPKAMALMPLHAC